MITSSVVPPTQQQTQTPHAFHQESSTPTSSLAPAATPSSRFYQPFLHHHPHRLPNHRHHPITPTATATATITTGDHQNQYQQPQDVPLSDLTLSLTRTFVITPPLSTTNIVHVAFHDPLLITASTSIISVYDVDVEPPTTSLSTRPPAFLVAHWPSPPNHSIAAIALSPDATVLAAVIHTNPTTTNHIYSSALVLFNPRTCTRLMRLALPDSFSFICDQKKVAPSVSFISTAHDAQNAASTPPPCVLPQHLRAALSKHDCSNRRAKSSAIASAAAAAIAWGDVAPWSLTVCPFSSSYSPESTRAHMLVVSFRRGYRRLHQLTHVSLPMQKRSQGNEPVEKRVFRQLDSAGAFTLGFSTKQSAFCLVNASSIDRTVARADIPLHSLIATFNSSPSSGGCVVASCIRANGMMGLAVVDDVDMQLVGTSVDLKNVRHVQFVNVSGVQPAIVVVCRSGFPIIVGAITLDTKRKGRPVVSAVEVSDKHRGHLSDEEIENSQSAISGGSDDDLECEDGAAVDVTVSGDSIISAFTKDRRVILRVTTLKYIQANT